MRTICFDVIYFHGKIFSRKITDFPLFGWNLENDSENIFFLFNLLWTLVLSSSPCSLTCQWIWHPAPDMWVSTCSPLCLLPKTLAMSWAFFYSDFIASSLPLALLLPPNTTNTIVDMLIEMLLAFMIVRSNTWKDDASGPPFIELSHRLLESLHHPPFC